MLQQLVMLQAACTYSLEPLAGLTLMGAAASLLQRQAEDFHATMAKLPVTDAGGQAHACLQLRHAYKAAACASNAISGVLPALNIAERDEPTSIPPRPPDCETGNVKSRLPGI